MGGYLINFSIYTMAMIGVIFFALFIFKTVSTKGFSKKSSMLKIEDSINLSQRKTLYVIKAEGERFLISADIDRTNLIAKLGPKTNVELKSMREDKSAELFSSDGIESLDEFASIIDFQKNKNGKEPMMKGLARKLNVI